MDLTTIKTWITNNKLTAIAIGVALAGGAAYVIMRGTGSRLAKQVNASASSVKGLLGTGKKRSHHHKHQKHPRIKLMGLK